MKKIKSTLMILTSVFMISAFSVSTAYANENEVELSDSTIESSTDEKITDLEEIRDLINNFIEEQNLSSTVTIDVFYDIDGNEYHVVNVTTYYWEKEKMQNFVSESNIDTNLISYYINEIGLVKPLIGDANRDNVLNVRDCFEIASKLALNKVAELPGYSDYNDDGSINIRDVAAIANHLATD